MTQLTPSASYSIALRLRLPNRPGALARVTQAIAEVGGSLSRIDLIHQSAAETVREICVDAVSSEHAQQIQAAVASLPNVKVERVVDRTFELHRGGKLQVVAKSPLESTADLAMAYTPGVGRVALEIAADPSAVYEYTIKGNCVGIVTDGSAVLGLGNIGPEAALPVMEGKAALFKRFADIDAFPLCLATQEVAEIVETVVRLAPGFGGFNLEDISAPRCFAIESQLKARLNLPVFHDDQHGTAIVVLAALLNALKVVKKNLGQVRIVINGAGAAGIAVTHLLQQAGATHVVVCDRQGILSRSRSDLTPEKAAIAVEESGSLAEALVGADVFIGVSVANALTPEMVETMAPDPIVFALANPVPEIQPELVADRVAVMATGRSDYPNQINNVLAFPGVFRGALDCRAQQINTEMCLAAAQAIANLISPEDLDPQWIIPSVFDGRVVPQVAAAVIQAARQTGVAGIP
ncbi:malic enzyme-like NAD(P)-binding protein [Synechococcus sp. O70.2]|jgi:malate dehydrogenase (oxaloacetate-decarboxylating)|uniref:malic enzyme-like NAD(P)-binding protein n=1 Tax=unclassified Synechococcus TaxID=2626047 RepID=UPI0039C0304A